MKYAQLFNRAFNSRKQLFRAYVWVVVTGILMILLRKFLHFRAGYSFLLWNFALASISPIISTLMLEMARMKWKPITFLIPVMVWLLFLPNGPYMLTDYKYIWNDNSGHIYPNIACLSWFILPALLLSLISLNDIAEILKLRYSPGKVTVFIFFICLLSGFGVFIGSILRFNSWDILHHPLALFNEIVRYFIHPVVDRNPWVVTLSYGSLFFLMFKVFGEVSKALQKNS
jgi:uncharacterized membrane protein